MTAIDPAATEVSCPFCESDEVERESPFGSELSKSRYYCTSCQTVFERLKWDGKQPTTLGE